MKIAFVSELNFNGKVNRNHENMRTEYSWICALNADHYSINNVINEQNNISNYDLIIVILPKKLELIDCNRLKQSIKNLGKKITVMQEGPCWYYQDYDYVNQVNYINFLSDVDFLLVHNKSDIKYFSGMFNKPIFNLKSLLIEDLIKNIIPENQGHPIIGGNFCSWYGGIDSYFVAQTFKKLIYLPSMGRKIKNEEYFPNIQHLPYMSWYDWMKTLSKFNVGIHLMRTHAAGTFALNCAYFGIPCIGYKGLDTQETLFPDLSVEVGDLQSAKSVALKLENDKEFYKFVSNKSKKLYKENYNEESWIKEWNVIYNNVFKNEK